MSNTNNSNLEVTPLSSLTLFSRGQLIELPSFDGGDEPFVVRLKRPSLLALCKAGKIPNKLLSTAMDLFTGSMKTSDNEGGSNLVEVTEIMDTLIEAAMLEPKLSELKAIELELTDEQRMAIFNYTQEGVKGLDSFRKESENNIPGGNGLELSPNSL